MIRAQPHCNARALGKGILAMVVLVLTGCASVNTSKQMDTGQLAFEINGRLGIRFQDQSEQAQLYWRHGDKGDWLSLEGPLGQTVATLSSNADKTVLITTDRTWEAADPEALTEEALGWRLPLGGLSQWITGTPDTRRTYEWQTTGQPDQRTLRQDGWEIRYSTYFTDTPQHLPRKLELIRDELHLKLVVDQWTTGPAMDTKPQTLQ